LGEFLSNPAVQGGVAPFAAALVVALALGPLRLGGLALIAGFLVGMHLTSGLQFTPLTATRKLALAAIAAPAVGLLVDFAFKPTRIGSAVLALAAAAAAWWAFGPVIANKPAAEAWTQGASLLAALIVLVATGQQFLAADPVRAGAAALGLGIAGAVAAVFSATLSYGQYALAIGAAAGAFLLPQMITGRKSHAGATFTLSAMLAGGLVAGGTMVLATLPWYALLVLALVPLGGSLPVPARAPVWLQAVLLSLYCFAIGAAACALAWPAGGIRL
jgi:hypothetical protein